MTDHFVAHATFSLERFYPARADRVFAALPDPVAKSRWFGAGGEHQLDFRVDGREVYRGRHGGGSVLTFESVYHEIIRGDRIVYASTLSAGGTVSTVSITTLEFSAANGGTRLVLTEQSTFLDGREQPGWREQGTGDWLDALGEELNRQSRA
jgi:uncharacterized protein YndB with AHSA1/START domain